MFFWMLSFAFTDYIPPHIILFFPPNINNNIRSYLYLPVVFPAGIRSSNEQWTLDALVLMMGVWNIFPRTFLCFCKKAMEENHQQIFILISPRQVFFFLILKIENCVGGETNFFLEWKTEMIERRKKRKFRSQNEQIFLFRRKYTQEKFILRITKFIKQYSRIYLFLVFFIIIKMQSQFPS